MPRSSSVPRRRSEDEHLLLHAQELLDRELLRHPAAAASDAARAALPGDEDEHDQQPDHDDTQERNHQFHARTVRRGV